MKRISIIIFSALLFSCNSKSKEETTEIPIQETEKPIEQNPEVNSTPNETAENTNDIYEKIHVAFEGMPEIEKVKPLMEAVMEKYNLPITTENINKCGSALVSLKHESKIGITEMEILKHMYQKGEINVNFPTQAAMSLMYLEGTK